MVLATLVIASSSMAASWSAFIAADFDDIYLDELLVAENVDYELFLGSAPTITLGSHTYDVVWIQSFYVVSGTENGTFVATDGSNTAGWSWNSKTSGGQISGWNGQGGNRIYPGESRKFVFSAFDPGANPVVMGFHLGYMNGDNEVITGWYKDGDGPDFPSVPEPSSMLALMCGAVGMVGMVRRRRS